MLLLIVLACTSPTDTGDTGPTDTGPDEDSDYAWVPAGSFAMGGPGAESLALPEHQVTLTRGYWLGKAEVTNAEFLAVLEAARLDGQVQGHEEGTTVLNAQGTAVELVDLDGAGSGTNRARIQWTGESFAVEEGYEDHPVSWLTWFGAAFYCNRLSEDEGLEPLIDQATWAVDLEGPGYRLPTEAEWEWAARYEDGRAWPWGETEPTEALANYDFQVGETSPVCSYEEGKSELGLCDLGGNVLEWTASRHGDYSEEPVTDPSGPTDIVERVIRGGSWNHEVERLHTWDRHYDPRPSEAYGGIGFRVLRLDLQG